MAVTVNYENPVIGTTAPTAAQSALANEVSATVIATADADVAATITHNLAISAADIAAGLPWVIVESLLSQALAALSAWTVNDPKGANAVVLTKLATAGSGNAAKAIRVHVMRPHTLIH